MKSRRSVPHKHGWTHFVQTPLGEKSIFHSSFSFLSVFRGICYTQLKHRFVFQFHEDDDNMANCSLSFARRWVYLICDYCCQDLNIPLIPESHVPPTADIDRTSRLTSLASSRVTSRAESRASCATNSHYYDDVSSICLH